MKISHAISRTSRSNIGLFVLILMHFSCSFQIWALQETVLICLQFPPNFQNEDVKYLRVITVQCRSMEPDKNVAQWYKSMPLLFFGKQLSCRPKIVPTMITMKNKKGGIF